MVYVQEEISDARMRCDEVRAMVSRCLDLVNRSNQKDHLYAIAGDIIYGLPQSLLALQRALEAAAMAVNKVDYEDLRQTLRPEKVEELERVLESVRLRIPRRTGSSRAASSGQVDPRDATAWLEQVDAAVMGLRGTRSPK
jgi:hypothetical protein